MEKLAISDKIFYTDFLTMGKDVYLYPGRFMKLFASKDFLKALFEDKARYSQYLDLKKENPIPDVFLFKMSYILNPYMSLRYHKFIFSSYQELGKTIISYGPVVDVYLKDLLIYHLLSAFMVRMKDDFFQEKIYKDVLHCEEEALDDPNLAYWDLGFCLSGTNKLVYEGKTYDDPTVFFNDKLVMSALVSFSSTFLTDRLVLAWLKRNGLESKVQAFLDLSSVSDEKEETALKLLGEELETRFGSKSKL